MKKIIDRTKKIIDDVPEKVLSETLAFTLCLSFVTATDFLANSGPYKHADKVTDLSLLASVWCGFLVMLSCHEPSMKKFYLGITAASATGATIGFACILSSGTSDDPALWLVQAVSANIGLVLLALIFAGVAAHRENKENKPNEPKQPKKPKKGWKH